MTVQTIKLKGNEYATVPQRLKQFREDNPRANVETSPTIQPDGQIVFKAHIVRDKRDPDSPEATGHSYGPSKGEKAFEKLETVAVGRALSLLGYLNNGQIASSEEMEQFEAHRRAKYEERIQEAKTVEELLGIFNDMDSEEKKQFTEILGEKKKELTNATA